MNNLIERLHEIHPIITDTDLDLLIEGTADARYGKVKRMLASGKLIRLRRGLYYLKNRTTPHTFELAQFIYDPSYISLESALSHHQLIPEAVYTTTSVCTKRSKTFSTSLREFSFTHMPTKDFYVGVKLIKHNQTQFLIATPWKAICDLLYTSKRNWRDINDAINDLRLDTDALPPLNLEEASRLINYYNRTNITKFLNKTLKEQ